MDTGFTLARYVNKFKYESRYDMLNRVALELWVHGEDGNGFGIPTNAFFTSDLTDDIQRLCRTGKKDGLKWARSDLKLGKFRFMDCLDFTNGKSQGMRGSPPSHLRMTEKYSEAFLAGSLQRVISGIHHAQERGAPIPLGVDFPYEPGDQVHFLGPRGRILSKSGRDYRVAHSGTRILSLIKKYISTLKTRKSHSEIAALYPYGSSPFFYATRKSFRKER